MLLRMYRGYRCLIWCMHGGAVGAAALLQILVTLETHLPTAILISQFPALSAQRPCRVSAAAVNGGHATLAVAAAKLKLFRFIHTASAAAKSL